VLKLLGKKPQFNDGLRRPLASKGKTLRRQALKWFWGLVTSNTLVRLREHLMAQQYDSNRLREPELAELGGKLRN